MSLRAAEAEMWIEAALLTADEPLEEAALMRLGEPAFSADETSAALASLQKRWEGRALQPVPTVAGWRFRVQEPAFAALGRLEERRPPRYSRAVLETLTVIAYHQPVTRGEIEAIRGVAVSSSIMQILQERGWIASTGRRDTLGRPTLWATTAKFLTDLQLHSTAALPPLQELGSITGLDTETGLLPDKTGSEITIMKDDAEYEETEIRQ